MARPRDVAKRTNNPSAPDLEFLTIRDVLTEQRARLYAQSIRLMNVSELQQKVGECSVPYISTPINRAFPASLCLIAHLRIGLQAGYVDDDGWMGLFAGVQKAHDCIQPQSWKRDTNRFVRRRKGTPQVLSASRCLFSKESFWLKTFTAKIM